MSETQSYQKIVSIIGVSIALFGVLSYFVDQYIDRQERRNNVSLGYIERYQSGDILETRLDLYSKWSSSPNLAEFLRSNPSEINLARSVAALVEVDPEFVRDIIKVANLLDTIYFCIESSNCALRPLQSGVMSSAKNFSALYGPYLDKLRSEGLISGTGRGLEKLVLLDLP